MSENQPGHLSKRCEHIRRLILQLSFNARSAHVGSSLSSVEILASAYHVKQNEPTFRDASLILSKGHAAMSLYATAIEFGDLDESVVSTYLKDGTTLWGHPSVSEKHPFINWSTGSLGHGLPAATGMAYARKYLKNDSRPVMVVLSDGELDEGSNWEAILFSAHHKLNNLTAIIDYNKIQSFGRCEDVMTLEPLIDKWRSFGWSVTSLDGHSHEALVGALRSSTSRPHVIIAHTIKGRGVTEYEDTIESHYKPISAELLEKYVGQKSQAK